MRRQDDVTALPRAGQEVRLRGGPPVGTTADLICAFSFPSLRAVLLDLLDADQVSNRGSHSRPRAARLECQTVSVKVGDRDSTGRP